MLLIVGNGARGLVWDLNWANWNTKAAVHSWTHDSSNQDITLRMETSLPVIPEVIRVLEVIQPGRIIEVFHRFSCFTISILANFESASEKRPSNLSNSSSRIGLLM